MQRKLADENLAGVRWYSHPQAMFLVTESDAAAIREMFDKEGELSAAIELRRRFPGIQDNALARVHARNIAGWQPIPNKPATVTPLRRREKP